MRILSSPAIVYTVVFEAASHTRRCLGQHTHKTRSAQEAHAQRHVHIAAVRPKGPDLPWDDIHTQTTMMTTTKALDDCWLSVGTRGPFAHATAHASCLAQGKGG
mmetsp:Transcript_63842/g.102756  ORF Transcript_63842/g.102756 Transcript_63842/m.102756 type:complete len:104 (+) Transcript_63842:16-327(+)